jgi:hypothetical protein
MPNPPILLNAKTGVVTYGEVTMQLSGKLASLLTALARRNGQPVQHERLAIECWPGRPRSQMGGSIRVAVWAINRNARKAGIPINIENRRFSFAYSCVGVTIESGIRVTLTQHQVDELRLALEPCSDLKLLDRVWGYIDA